MWSRLEPEAKGQYTLMCNHKGGVVDDLYLYCLGLGELPTDRQRLANRRRFRLAAETSSAAAACGALRESQRRLRRGSRFKGRRVVGTYFMRLFRR